MRTLTGLILVAVLAGACVQAPVTTSRPVGFTGSADATATAEPAATAPATVSPRPSPDALASLSGELAYAGGADPQVHLVDLATGESRQLTQLTPDHAQLTGRGPIAPALSCGFGVGSLRWSPDGSALAFDYGACDRVVYVLRLDGTLTRIADGHAPAWSPDGARLVFAPAVPWCPAPDCGDPPTPGAWNLQTVDLAAGATVRPLHVDEVTAHAGQPSFSPDGSLIAFTARLPDPGLHAGLFAATYVSNADGSKSRLVARGAWPAGWLPDGRLLVVDERTSQLRAVDLATADATPLGLGGDRMPASPDGTRLLLRPVDPLTGAGVVQLTTLDGDVLAQIPGQSAAWAPDGRAAAIVSAEGAGSVVIVDRDGAELGVVEIGAGPVLSPQAAWRPGT